MAQIFLPVIVVFILLIIIQPNITQFLKQLKVYTKTSGSLADTKFGVK